jgi:hypothetical protein
MRVRACALASTFFSRVHQKIVSPIYSIHSLQESIDALDPNGSMTLTNRCAGTPHGLSAGSAANQKTAVEAFPAAAWSAPRSRPEAIIRQRTSALLVHVLDMRRNKRRRSGRLLRANAL